MDDKIGGGPQAGHIHEQSGGEKAAPVEVRDHLRQLSLAELEIEKKLRKKIDLRIMPICVLIYLLNYIDR